MLIIDCYQRNVISDKLGGLGIVFECNYKFSIGSYSTLFKQSTLMKTTRHKSVNSCLSNKAYDNSDYYSIL